MATQTKKDKFYEDLVAAVRADFEERQEERRQFELQWELNRAFASGNQYCDVSPVGEVEDQDKDYFWQSRNVYNHIAPVVETRLAKLSRVRPTMSVRAATGEDGDIKTAKLTSRLLESACQKIDLNQIIAQATGWSEICGTVFYKIVWDGERGKSIDGKKEGDVRVECCPPYEIYPDTVHAETLSAVRSLIHARAVHIDDIYARYGVHVEAENLTPISLGETVERTPQYALVIERYERPSESHPNGRMITVCGDQLLQIGELPYVNGTDGVRDFPFVRQVASARTGCFFGTSVVERLIPIQRAFNAVKNRKQEFLNRMSVGVVAVEDGSTDVDELVDEGLSPGKVVVYRQGSHPPQMMNTGGIPSEFAGEEDNLLSEMVLISGVSEITRTSNVPNNVTSGVALQLLIEQDETRLAITAENIRFAVKEIAKQMLRLYRQFATEKRMMRASGEGKKVEIVYFQASDISSDDVVFDTENELSSTPAQKKSLVLDLLNTGLLTDENGRIDNRMRAKLLEILGFGGIESAQDLMTLHIAKASEENLGLFKKEISPDEYDDHDVHVSEHVRFMLSGEFDGKEDVESIKQRFVQHVRMHKVMAAVQTETEQIQQ